jgi:hypothetical protein
LIQLDLSRNHADATSCPFYRRNGFIQSPSKPQTWSRSLAKPLEIPAHIHYTLSGETITAKEAVNLGLPSVVEALQVA